ncbi:hypothetical protein CUMW_112400, partial [Citrus unshiu]
MNQISLSWFATCSQILALKLEILYMPQVKSVMRQFVSTLQKVSIIAELVDESEIIPSNSNGETNKMLGVHNAQPSNTSS